MPIPQFKYNKSSYPLFRLHLDMIDDMQADVASCGVHPRLLESLRSEGSGDVGKLMEEVEAHGTHHPQLLPAQSGGEGGIPHPFRDVHRRLAVAAAEVEAEVGI